MKFLRALLIAAVAAVGFMAAQPSYAATQVLCAPDASNASSGARRVVTPGGTGYTLNPAGCAVIAQADVGWFLTQGFSNGPNDYVISYTTGVATSTTDFVIGNLPANAYIKTVIYQNTTANAVTGGITLGSTANGTDVSTATTVGASALVQATDAQLVKRAWSTTAATPIHAAAATAWNSANVTITLIYGYF